MNIFRQKLLAKLFIRLCRSPPNQIQLTGWETDVDKQLAKIITSKIGYLSPNWTLQIKWKSHHSRSQHKNNTKLGFRLHAAVADSVERVCVFGIRIHAVAFRLSHS